MSKICHTIFVFQAQRCRSIGSTTNAVSTRIIISWYVVMIIAHVLHDITNQISITGLRRHRDSVDQDHIRRQWGHMVLPAGEKVLCSYSSRL